MADSTIQQIKDKLDIVEVVSGYVRLEKTGINLRAPCPFHQEKKPSFFVSPARQSFKCFGCSKSGDIFTFIQEIEGIEFGDALRLLAKRAGVELKNYSPELRTARQRLYEICEIAAKFFQKQLLGSQKGKQALKYLKGRGISDESIKQWRIGYAPSSEKGSWRALSDFLVSLGYQRDEVVKAGLAVESEKAKLPYDRFRGRIIFPIFDLHSQVIGFGGRVFGQDQNIAKYLNIPNTLLYDKSQALYGLNFAKLDIRKKDVCILTEGYTDVILSHQEGFTNTVSSSGTALTPHQLQVLKRYSSNLLTAFDMDSAGDMATKRGIGLAVKSDFEVKVIAMPQGQDPADVLSNNPKKWSKLIDRAENIMDFYFSSALHKYDKDSPAGKKEISKLLLPKIKEISNKILQAHWAQKLAGVIKIKEEAIFEELKKIVKKPEPAALSQPSSMLANARVQTKPRKNLLEERIIALILKAPSAIGCLKKVYLPCFSEKAQIVITAFQKEMPCSEDKLNKVCQNLAGQNNQLQFLLDSQFLETDLAEQNIKQEIELCLAQLQRLSQRTELEQLSSQIKQAENENNLEKINKLMQRFNQLAKAP